MCFWLASGWQPTLLSPPWVNSGYFSLCSRRVRWARSQWGLQALRSGYVFHHTPNWAVCLRVLSPLQGSCPRACQPAPPSLAICLAQRETTWILSCTGIPLSPRSWRIFESADPSPFFLSSHMTVHPESWFLPWVPNENARWPFASDFPWNLTGLLPPWLRE